MIPVFQFIEVSGVKRLFHASAGCAERRVFCIDGPIGGGSPQCDERSPLYVIAADQADIHAVIFGVLEIVRNICHSVPVREYLVVQPAFRRDVHETDGFIEVFLRHQRPQAGQRSENRNQRLLKHLIAHVFHDLIPESAKPVDEARSFEYVKQRVERAFDKIVGEPGFKEGNGVLPVAGERRGIELDLAAERFPGDGGSPQRAAAADDDVDPVVSVFVQIRGKNDAAHTGAFQLHAVVAGQFLHQTDKIM